MRSLTHITHYIVALTLMLSLPQVQAPAEEVQWNPFGEPRLAVPEANVYIPNDDHLTQTIRVAAVYNEDAIRIFFEFDTDTPSWYHDYWVYEDGAWARLGRGTAGPEAQGLYEDRIAMMFDDGSVPGFAEYGGYVVMHSGVDSRSDSATAEEKEAALGTDEVNKFLRQSREEDAPESETWRMPRDEASLAQLKAEGLFIDTWQWRAHRSNPIGYADNGYVLDARNSAAGRSMYSTNWSDELEAPAYMYDVEQVGLHALRKDTLLNRNYGMDDYYYLFEDFAKPFDPEHDWQDGDVLPRRILQIPDGNRGAIRAEGRWEAGTWRVSMTRDLELADSSDSKPIVPGEVYNVAFAAFTGATQGRWHYVSMPLQLGLGEAAQITAHPVSGDLDDAEVTDWTEIPLFYVGQMTFAHISAADNPVFETMDLAREEPLDSDRITQLANALADHEINWLQDAGFIEANE